MGGVVKCCDVALMRDCFGCPPAWGAGGGGDGGRETGTVVVLRGVDTVISIVCLWLLCLI